MRYPYFLLAVLFLLTTACKHQPTNGSETANDSTATAEEWVENENHDYIVNLGDMAPDFTLVDMEGNEVTLSSLRGKVVMLQFTASWCGVCRKEMPQIEQQIWQQHKDNPNFALFGVDREDDFETTTRFIQKTGITYPMLRDTVAAAFDLYAIHDSGITRNVVIDKEGKIVMMTRLYDEEEFARLCETLNTLLAKE